MIDPVEARRRRRLLMAAFIGGLAVVSVALYFFVYRPQLEELARVKEEAERMQGVLENELSAQSTALMARASEIEKWRMKVEELKRKLPDREDFEHLLLEVAGLAERAGLREFSLLVKREMRESSRGARKEGSRVVISPASDERRGRGGREKAAEGVEELPVQAVSLELGFRSGYRNLARFLRGLGATTRATRFDEVSVRREGNRMYTSIRLRAYYRNSVGAGR